MKLKLFFITSLISFSALSGQVLLNENFENGIPPSWEIKKTNQTESWKIKGPDAYDVLKTKVAVVDGDNANKMDQDEWLITPPVNLGNAKSPSMDFTIYASTFWLQQMNTVDFFIKASIDNGVSWTTLFDDSKIPFDPDFGYVANRLSLDLSAYVGKPALKLAFHYKTNRPYNNPQDAAASVILDNIVINAEKDKYCTVYFPENAVEPITSIEFAGIKNRTSEITDGTNSYENFQNIIGEAEKGKTYDFTAEAVAADHPQNIIAYIDWNQNGSFSNSETFAIGTIESSSGNDGQKATLSIKIPDFAVPGPTRLRIVSGSDFSPPPCFVSSTYSSGQVEDYTVLIKGDPVIDPNNGCDIFQTGIFDESPSFGSFGYWIANDFAIKANQSKTISKMEFDIKQLLPDPYIKFYKDNNGKPGELIKTFKGDFTSYLSAVNGKYTVEFTNPLTLQGEITKDAIYWISFNFDDWTEEDYRWGSADKVTNSTALLSENSGATWSNFSYDNAFAIFGECKVLAVNEVSNKKLAIYPNPVVDYLTIQSDRKISDVQIFNTNGQILKNIEMKDSRLNLKSLQKGIYILKLVFTDGTSETAKLIK